MTDHQVPEIFSRQRRRLRDQRASYRQARVSDPANWLSRVMAEDAIERIDFVRLEPKRVWLAGDLSGTLERYFNSTGADVVAPPLASVDEELPLDGGPFDLAISLDRLGSVNDLPGALIHLRNALAPGGMMIAMMVGGGSLPALRSAMLAADGDRPAPRLHPQVESRSATGLLERAGFSRQVVDEHGVTVRYPDLGKLVSDLRDQALTAVLARGGPALSKAALKRAEAAFSAQADDEGRIAERFEILTLTGWR
ncbi:methyltransferase [Porphyrobacter algicida]|uniref:Methyltransferase n=1 Tax=Qipengyuania algicida TaxID=1836209 RepID=A0A845AG76_9SPHN|nr:methyltransferase domain-containing protein [Qipengyuania algicida]MXP28409.1 methyltransferase [Qipengyuania algicida]